MAMHVFDLGNSKVAKVFVNDEELAVSHKTLSAQNIIIKIS